MPSVRERLKELAEEVAYEFDGTYSPVLNFDGDYQTWADVLVPAYQNIPAYRIHFELSRRRDTPHKLMMSMHPIHDKSEVITYGIIFPTAVFDIMQDMEIICTEIWERIVNAEVAETLREYDRYRQELLDKQKQLDQHLSDLLAIFPNLRVANSFDDELKLYSYDSIPSINASLRANSFIFTRIGAMSVAKAKRILAILVEKENNT